jgi:hypothetical protein
MATCIEFDRMVLDAWSHHFGYVGPSRENYVRAPSGAGLPPYTLLAARIYDRARLRSTGTGTIPPIFSAELESDLVPRPDNKFDEARIASTSQASSKAWMAPFSCSLTMSNDDYRTAMRLRCGLPLGDLANAKCPRCMLAYRDLEPTHPLSACRGGSFDHTRRHNMIRDRLVHAICTEGIACSREVTVQYLFDEFNIQCSADSANLRFDFATTSTQPKLLTDLTIVDPCCRTNLNAALQSPGRLLTDRAHQKRQHYLPHLGDHKAFLFFPLVVDVFGAVDPGVSTFLLEVAKLTVSPQATLRELKGLLARAVQAGNAAVIRSSMANPRGRRHGVGSDHDGVSNPLDLYN